MNSSLRRSASVHSREEGELHLEKGKVDHEKEVDEEKNDEMAGSISMENDALQLDLSFDMEEFDDWELQY